MKKVIDIIGKIALFTAKAITILNIVSSICETIKASLDVKQIENQ